MANALSLSAPRRSDRAILGAVLLLAAAGVVAVYSAISFLAETKAGGDTELFLFRHLVRIGVGLGVMAAFSLVDYRWLARASRLFVILGLALLVFVQVRGVVTNGAARWIDLGIVTFQPSDLAKVAILLHTAVLLAKKQPYIESLARGYLPLLFWIAPTLLLIGMEDLSTAAILLATLTAMMFVGRVRVTHLLGTVVVGLVLAIAFLAANPQRAARIDAWLGTNFFTTEQTASATHSDQAEGYQARQAKIAFAMGGVTGRGPGKSVQRDFLPAPYNDFIFAIVAEEYGLAGAIGLLVLFVWLLARGMLRIARGAADPLGLFLAAGITCAVALGGFVNAAVATGLAPVTGLAMPFVSYGGTSLLATGAMVGILLNISRHADVT